VIVSLANLRQQQKTQRVKQWKYDQLCKHIQKKCSEDLKIGNPLLQFKLAYAFDSYEKEFIALEKSRKSLTQDAKGFYNSCLGFVGVKVGVRWKCADKCEHLKAELNQKLEATVIHLKEKYKNHQIDTSKKFEREKTNLLKKWFHEHSANPYPSEAEKRRLAYVCDMLPKQVSTWFGNYRLRYKLKMEAKVKREPGKRKRKIAQNSQTVSNSKRPVKRKRVLAEESDPEYDE